MKLKKGTKRLVRAQTYALVAGLLRSVFASTEVSDVVGQSRALKDDEGDNGQFQVACRDLSQEVLEELATLYSKRAAEIRAIEEKKA